MFSEGGTWRVYAFESLAGSAGYFPSCWSVNVVRKRRQGAAGRGRLSSNCAVWFPHFFISDNSLFIRWPNATVPEDGVDSTLKELEKARTDGENAKASEAIAWRKLSKLEAVLQRAKEEAGRAPRRILGPAIATCYYQDAT
jgi:hypothetical protein